MSRIVNDFCRTMAPPTSQPIWPYGWMIRKSSTSGARSNHPQTQEKNGRYRQTMKNGLLLNIYNLLRELEDQIAAFMENYIYRRLYECLNNLTPADVFFGRGQAIFQKRRRIKNAQSKIVAGSIT
jgi:hypothetical protein